VTFTLPELLDNLAERPAMHTGVASFETVRAFLSGLAAGLEFAGIKYTWEDYLAAANARGWDPRGSIGIERDFREDNLTKEEMILELVAVEKAAYLRAANRDRQ
jgi:hypothetical protein